MGPTLSLDLPLSLPQQRTNLNARGLRWMGDALGVQRADHNGNVDDDTSVAHHRGRQADAKLSIDFCNDSSYIALKHDIAKSR